MDHSYAVQMTKGLGGASDLMQCGRFKARLMRAQRLVGDGIFSLPPGTALPTFPIAALPGCPESWVSDEGSYVCPVSADWGLWFDYTENDHLNTAVLPSVKGMNPITGEKLEGLELKSYKKKCPTHGVPFVKGSKRFCEKCNFEWPPQSYICAPNTLWWDGFRQPDGTVRQFFFSEDEVRDVASVVIGKKNTVPAFGFAFYEPVKRREPPPQSLIRGITSKGFGSSLMNFDSKKIVYGSNICAPTGPTGSTGSTGHCGQTTIGQIMYSSPVPDMAMCDCSVEEKTSGGITWHNAISNDVACLSESIKDVAVGAGARIRQDLEPDTLKLSDWQIKPSAVMRLYFVFEKEFKQIVSKGIRDIVGDKSGFLKGLPVG